RCESGGVAAAQRRPHGRFGDLAALVGAVEVAGDRIAAAAGVGRGAARRPLTGGSRARRRPVLLLDRRLDVHGLLHGLVVTTIVGQEIARSANQAVIRTSPSSSMRAMRAQAPTGSPPRAPAAAAVLVPPCAPRARSRPAACAPPPRG